MAACIFPGTRSALNFFGMSAVRCGMWRSPITRTSTWTSTKGRRCGPRVWQGAVGGVGGSSPCASKHSALGRGENGPQPTRPYIVVLNGFSP